MGPFVSAFLLGIAFCAPPGVVFAEATRRGLARGFQPALLVELGSLIGDAVWAVVALAGAALIVQHAPVRVALGVAGALLLGYLAFRALADAWSGHEASKVPEAGAASGGKGDFATGAMLSLANPFAIAFWVSVGGAMAIAADGEPAARDFVRFFSGFMSGALLWCFFIAAVIAGGRRFVTPNLLRAINLACGLALAYFASSLLGKVFGLSF
jgi:chemosensory pili system protein ChpE